MHWEKLVWLFGDSKSIVFTLLAFGIWIASFILGIICLTVVVSYILLFKKTKNNRQRLLDNEMDLNFWYQLLFFKYTLVENFFLVFDWWCNEYVSLLAGAFCSSIVAIVTDSIPIIILGFLISFLPALMSVSCCFVELKLTFLIRDDEFFNYCFSNLGKRNWSDRRMLFVINNQFVDSIDLNYLAKLVNLKLINKAMDSNQIDKRIKRCKYRLDKLNNLSSKIKIKKARRMKADLMINYFVWIIELCCMPNKEDIPLVTDGKQTYVWKELVTEINRCFYTEYSF